jgi:hypothetical protein
MGMKLSYLTHSQNLSLRRVDQILPPCNDIHRALDLADRRVVTRGVDAKLCLEDGQES